MTALEITAAFVGLALACHQAYRLGRANGEQRGRLDGYDRGYAEGYADGRARGANEVKSWLFGEIAKRGRRGAA